MASGATRSRCFASMIAGRSQRISGQLLGISLALRDSPGLVSKRYGRDPYQPHAPRFFRLLRFARERRQVPGRLRQPLAFLGTAAAWRHVLIVWFSVPGLSLNRTSRTIALCREWRTTYV